MTSTTQVQGTPSGSIGGLLGGDSLSGGLLFPAIIFGAFWILVIYPHSKRQKKEQTEHQSLMDSLKTGDEVITTGGVLGKVVRLTEQYIILELSVGYEMTVQRKVISKVLPKGTLKNI